MHLKLRHKVNGAIIITFLLVAIVFSAIQLPFQQHRIQTSITSIEVLLQTLVDRDLEQLANEIFDSRLTALKIRLKQMKKVKGVLAIAVFDDSGRRLISVDSAAVFKNINLKEIENIRKQAQIQKKRWKGNASLLFSSEVNFLGEHLGFIRIYYSLADVEQNQKISFLIFASLLGSVFLVMIIVLNLLLSKAILKPIKYLMDATQLIAQGNLDQEIDMPRKDELGNLAKSFKNMRDAIKEKILDLERLTIILESTSDLVSISTPKAKIIYLNRAGRKMVGWDEKESLSKKLLTEIHPEWAVNTIINIGIPWALKNKTWEGETALIGCDGNEIPASQVIMSHKNSEGKLEFLSSIMRDITAPRKAEQELKHLKNYLNNVFDSMPSVLVGVDANGDVTQWNTQAMRVTGISPKNAVGLPFVNSFPDLSDEIKNVHKAILTRKTQFDPKKASAKNGEIRYEDITVYPLISNGVEGAVIRVDDVTEKIRLEEMMIQSEKMLSVGGLAAGMAHEINNPLAGIIQTADVMANRIGKNMNIPANLKAAEEAGTTMEAIQHFMEARGIYRMVTTINNSGLRVAEIVNNMLSFARKSDSTVSSHHLSDLMDKTLELAATDYNLKKQYDFKTIKIVKEYEKDLPIIPCEGAKIQQVLLNILRNGAQAMQETKKVSRKNPMFILRLSQEIEINGLRIEIEDNGPGMNEATRKRIFEPFFTTKPVDIGTGLGLSISYFIITENHGGEMSVESTPGFGTKFIIRLPLELKKNRPSN